LYRKPSLLVLDEATSHLDIERERQINAAVTRMPITRIVIAHRPETIVSAQRALLVANGAVQPIPSQLHEVEVAG
jgi:ATP-binding cassette subfamily B protein RaxB